MNNQEKTENLVEELYVLHKEAGERMVKLTEENKRILNEMQDSQKKMRKFVEEKVESERKWNMRFMWLLSGMFALVTIVILYVMIPFKSEVKHSIKKIAETSRVTTGTMAKLYFDQKEFIEKNKCNLGEKKESAEANKKLKGK